MRTPLHIRNHVFKKNRRQWCSEDMLLLVRLIVIGLLIAAGAMACTGCSQPIEKRKSSLFSNPLTRNRPHRALRMTCIWEPRMLSDKQGSVRGFQGEIIFFRDEKMQEPTIVDGELTVFVFDAEDTRIIDLGGAEGIEPIADYKFSKETLDRGLSKNKKTKMFSYGVWLPIDKMPGDEMNLVLWSRFEGSGENGELISSDQLTVYLPGNPVDKKKKQPGGETNAAKDTPNFDGIRQAAYEDIYDFGDVTLASYSEAVQAAREREASQPRERDDDAIPMSPAMARQIFGSGNASARSADRAVPRPARESQSDNTNRQTGPVGFGGGDSPQIENAGSVRNQARNQSRNRTENQAAIGFGSGGPPYNNGYRAGAAENQMLSRFRPNVSSIGGEINSRMQSGQFAAHPATHAYDDGRQGSGGGVQQVSYVAAADQNFAGTGATGISESRRQMTQMMIEQEMRRQREQAAVNDLGFTAHNANAFPDDQNRFTVIDRYASRGATDPSQDGAASSGRPSIHSAHGRFPAQNPGTIQPVYAESDWGPGLEQVRSSHETQVTYSPSPAAQIYR